MRFGTFTGPIGEYGMAMDVIFPADNYMPGTGDWSLNATNANSRIYTALDSSISYTNLLTGSGGNRFPGYGPADNTPPGTNPSQDQNPKG